jgi:mRNA interferase RelE/StbE
MTYKLVFLESALKEWGKLDPPIQERFKKKLSERLGNPMIPKDKLMGMEDCYKIKLRQLEYRLVYSVFQGRFVVQVIAVGKREHSLVYQKSKDRLG